MRVSSFQTLAAPHELEIDKVKRSRFIGLASPCGSEEDARAFVAGVRARFHDARHHCWAWRVGDEARASDDGEPHHSAGPPILKQIEGRDLSNVVVVVVRYFGGVKLGTGGLVRAYGAAAAAVLDDAQTRRVALLSPVLVTYDYALAGALQGALHRLGLEPVRSDYAASVTITLHVPEDRVESVVDALRDASGGAAEVRVRPTVAVAD